MRWSHAFILAVLLCSIPVSGLMAAFPSDDITFLERKDITLLSDEELIDTYIDVLAEMEATRAFHTTSGFTPKEYRQYKELVKYRLRLIFEIHRRKIEIPPSIE